MGMGHSKPLRLEVGKCYRTRDGRKAGPLTEALDYTPRRFSGNVADDDQPNKGTRMWLEDGTRSGFLGVPQYTLVAEWMDEGASTAETELEALIRQRNENTRRLAALAPSGAGLEISKLGADVWKDAGDAKAFDDWLEYRVTARPAFVPFYVNGGPASVDAWRVALDDKMLSVGCQTFPADAAMRALRSILKECVGVTSVHYGEYGLLQLTATRNGVKHDKFTLAYADADRILAALEAYFAEVAK